jgi:hypothetical protein
MATAFLLTGAGDFCCSYFMTVFAASVFSFPEYQWLNKK